MTRRAICIGLAASLALAACGATTTTVTRSGPEKIRPDAGGIAIQNSDLRIDFGRAEAGAVEAVSRVLGAQPQSRSVNTECGAGPTTIVKYPQIDLLFLDGAFRGWVTQSNGTVTGNGLSPGVPRRQLAEGAYGPFRETSLGVEFETGGIFGLLPDGGADTPIELLWAGTSCFFR